MRRRRTGFAGHQTQLYPELTARENLAFAARMHGLDDPNARADFLLAAEGLTHAANRRIAGFSRGMAQRVAIARSLVHEPSLVLLDEPFTGLDIAAAERLGQRIADMGSEGRTRILATHDLERAAALADTAIVLAAGRVAARLDGDALSLEALSQAVRSAPEATT